MKNQPPASTIFLLLKLAAASVFAGRAYQHFFWDAPYRELLWDDQLMKPFVERFTKWNWHEYVTSLAVDESIEQWMKVGGLLYLACALACLFLDWMPKWIRWPIWIGVIGLVVLALLYTKESFLHVGQFFEYTLQFCAPVFLMSFGKKRETNTELIFAIKLATALTFACHGLYAVGFYNRPGLFTAMTMQTLHCSEDFAIGFLHVAGWLDFLVALAVFLPTKYAKWVALYAALWGTLTSFARITGNFYPDFPLQSLHEWLYQTVYRLPHGLVPLALYYMLNTNKSQPSY